MATDAAKNPSSPTKCPPAPAGVEADSSALAPAHDRNKKNALAADKSYSTGEFLHWLWDQQIAPHIPVLDRKQQTKGFYTQRDFTPVPEENAYRCPEGKLLSYVGMRLRGFPHVKEQFFLAATVQNAKRLFLNQSKEPKAEMASNTP